MCPDEVAVGWPVRVRSGVVAKQPGSWWPAEGRPRPSKRHDKVLLEGEQVSGPYDEEPCSVVKPPRFGGAKREPSPISQVKPTDGAKSSDAEHPRTRRRREGGTLTQSTDETGEIRLGTGVNVAGRQPAMSGNGETYKQRPCEVVERRAEVGGGRSSEEGWDNTTRRSEGPLARCAGRPKTTVGLPLVRAELTHPSLAVRSRHRKRSLGRPTTSVAGRNADDRLPGESRMKENFMSRFGERVLETEQPDRPRAGPGSAC